MSLARQMFGQVQRRAFSVSARQVRPVAPFTIVFACHANCVSHALELQSCHTWCCRWYWPTSVPAHEAQSSCHKLGALRYSSWTRSVHPQEEFKIHELISSIGVAADISHINTRSVVKGYDPTPSGLRECLTGAEVVLIPAGVPRKPGMTRDGRKSCLAKAQNTSDHCQTSSTPTQVLSEILPRPAPKLLRMRTY